MDTALLQGPGPPAFLLVDVGGRSVSAELYSRSQI